MTIKQGFTFMAAVTALLAASGCVSSRDFSQWLIWEKPLQVTELRRSAHCGGEDAATRIRYFATLAQVQDWEESRGLQLTAGDAPLPKGPYALIELGKRDNAGYGFAVSRLAGRRRDTLTLKATFIEPAPGVAVQTSEPVTPCALVLLPRAYGEVELIDQTGALRASSRGAS